MTVWAEARGEPPRGQLAVAWVIRNRMIARAKSLREVVLEPAQFSCFGANDPNRTKMLRADELDPTGWAVADAICSLVESGDTLDPTKSSLNYYQVDMANPPSWGPPHPGWRDKVTIGKHRFGVAGRGGDLA
jgi:spore germination cell wall hydrolase CwlJ-like protein